MRFAFLAAFKLLDGRYPKSPWALKTRYYY
jgi:hypothetical protein